MIEKILFKAGRVYNRIVMLLRGHFINHADLENILGTMEIKLESKWNAELDKTFMQIIGEQKRIGEENKRSELRFNFLQDLFRQHVQMASSDLSGFETELRLELLIGLLSELRDNFDPFLGETVEKIQEEINTALLYYRKHFDGRIDQYLATLPMGKLNALHDTLDDIESQRLLVKLIAFRMLGRTKIRLRTTDEIESDRNFYKTLQNFISFDNPPFRSGQFEVKCYDLRPAGWNFYCYTIPFAINIEFRNLQYANAHVQIGQGDWVLDCGACWGDTSLLFADQTGPTGRVIAFEFVPSNLDIFQANIAINPELSERIEVIKQPVAESSGKVIRCQDNGAASSFNITLPEDIDAPFLETVTVSIDDWVERRNPPQIDFIKMDIEGAELAALQGAVQTLKRFRPQLAIALYHRPEDIFKIPEFIVNLDLGYRYYLKHPTAEGFETVLLATAD